MLGPNFKREEILRPIKIVPTLKIIDTDNFRHIFAFCHTSQSNILIFSQSPKMEHHIFQFFQHFISFPQVPIYLEYHQLWLDKRFLLFLHVNSKDHMWIWLKWPHNIPAQPFILLLKLTTTARFSSLRESHRLPETVILNHWFIFELILTKAFCRYPDLDIDKRSMIEKCGFLVGFPHRGKRFT